MAAEQLASDAEVLYELVEGVATATINRPDHRNSLNAAAITGLVAAVERTRRDRGARVLVITGAGEKAFCSGADLTAMFPSGSDGQGSTDEGVAGPIAGSTGIVEAHEVRGALACLFQAMWDLGKPTVAKVRGYALAGGFGLAMACDLVIASEDAVFGTPEINVGLWPYMITVPLLDSMPPKVALELMMTGRRVGAAEALRAGFVTKVVAAADLDVEVATTTAALANKSPAAMKLGRGSFYRVASMGRAEALDYLQAMLTVTTMTGDAAEGIAAFVEKRPPRWSGG